MFLVILSNFAFILLLVHSFGVKYAVSISKRYGLDIGGVIPFGTNRNIWVGGIENLQLLVLQNY